MRSSLSRRIDEAFAPAPAPGRGGWLAERPYAHRGLHGDGRAENSLSAFRAAAAAGHGIELDVRLSSDGFAIVFHDSALDRLTGESGALADRSAAELGRIRLAGGEDRIPTLAEAVAATNGVPLLIEIKTDDRHVSRLCHAVRRAVEGQAERVAIMSFHPEVPRWFAAHARHIVRGLVVSEGGKGWHGPIARRLALWRGKPEFLAYDVRDLPSRFAAAQRARGLPLLTWTCRSGDDRARAERDADQIIYETGA
jgi:glycerophosphoryl diester phosphodiesterase